MLGYDINAILSLNHESFILHPLLYHHTIINLVLFHLSSHYIFIHVSPSLTDFMSAGAIEEWIASHLRQ